MPVVDLYMTKIKLALQIFRFYTGKRFSYIPLTFQCPILIYGSHSSFSRPVSSSSPPYLSRLLRRSHGGVLPILPRPYASLTTPNSCSFLTYFFFFSLKELPVAVDYPEKSKCDQHNTTFPKAKYTYPKEYVALKHHYR